MAKLQQTSISFTGDELIEVLVSLGTELENTGIVWDDARSAGDGASDAAAYFADKHDRLSRLQRRFKTAQTRLARKEGRL